MGQENIFHNVEPEAWVFAYQKNFLVLFFDYPTHVKDTSYSFGLPTYSYIFTTTTTLQDQPNTGTTITFPET